jgi:hypothetical protein
MLVITRCLSRQLGLLACVLLAVSGCRACSDCYDNSSPVSDPVYGGRPGRAGSNLGVVVAGADEQASEAWADSDAALVQQAEASEEYPADGLTEETPIEDAEGVPAEFSAADLADDVAPEESEELASPQIPAEPIGEVAAPSRAFSPLTPLPHLVPQGR